MMYNILKTAMRYSPEHKAQTRDRILKAAARRFRSCGSEGAAIGDLMKDLRLTHGGFYKHFDSKESLFLEAFTRALEESASRADAAIGQARPGGELKALIDAYLDVEHCRDIANGCPVAALAAELSRRPASARAPYLQMLRSHIDRLAKYLPGDTPESRRGKAVALFSGMAGTLTIARAFTDEADQRRILDAAKKFYLNATDR